MPTQAPTLHLAAEIHAAVENGCAAIRAGFGHEAIRQRREALGARIVEALNSGNIDPLPAAARDLIWDLPQDAGEALRRVNVMIALEEAAHRRMKAGAWYLKVSRSRLDALHAMAIALQARPLAWARHAAE